MGRMNFATTKRMRRKMKNSYLGKKRWPKVSGQVSRKNKVLKVATKFLTVSTALALSRVRAEAAACLAMAVVVVVVGSGGG
ncbi:hypothetical protein TKK_0013482 [Trichogramma kaykai]